MEPFGKVLKPIYSTNVGNTDAVKKSKRVAAQNTPKTPLRRVDELPAKYREIFLPYSTFNVVQSSVFDCLLASDSSVVVSAPTGSGKTTLFELAIVRLVETCNLDSLHLGGNKIVYLAPVKALCSERYSDWTNKFRTLGLRTAEVTGDSTDIVELKTIENFDLILTTPEKWDAMTRRWRDHAGLVQLVKLFLIDEVHLLNEERRGPTLEAVVSRMKAVEETLKQSGTESQVRFVAVSATIPNIGDVAQWLGTPDCPARFYKFDESMRPVSLKKIVLGYPLRSKDKAYTFDLSLTYKLKQVIQTHANGKPTLIFCSSRKSVQQTCNTLKKTLSFNFTREQMEKLGDATSKITDNNLRELVKHGLGYHHAGLVFSDRQCLEEIFRTGFLPVLISTSTLAMGVNLPAHLVIIKSTEQYVCGEWQPYSESQILQMMGRAGRPQFDSTATAVIMTRDTNKGKYEKLMSGEELVESSLHNHLVEHLNSEIVLGTITDIAVAMNWLRSTFLYIRALKNPKHYGMPPNLTEREIESKLQAMCMRELHALEKYELITTSNYAYSVEPTENGKLMARYYIAFDTMKVFMKIEGTETLPELLELLTHCHEFQEIQLRRHERPVLNSLNRNRGKESIRFPIPGKITTKTAKANVLIQAVLGSLQIPDAGLLQESVKVMRLAERLLRGLTLYLGRKSNFQSLASALTLHKCSVVRMWENSEMVSRQLPGIGPALGALLVLAGKRTFKDIVETDPRTLERIINRQPPMGNTLQEAAQRIPQYNVDLVINETSFTILVLVEMLNPQEVQYGNMLHKFNLILSAGNQILRKEIVSDQTLVLQGGRYTLQAYAGDAIRDASEVTVTLISQSIVGIDVQAKVKPISDNTVPSQDHETSTGANRSTTFIPQKEDKNRKSRETSTISGLLKKYSFQPTRSKKLTKGINGLSSSSANAAPKSKIQPNSEISSYTSNVAAMDETPTETHITGNAVGSRSKSDGFLQNADNSNLAVIEILSSSSSGGSQGPKTGTAVKGKTDHLKNIHKAGMKHQELPQKDEHETKKLTQSTLLSQVRLQTQPKGFEAIDSKEDLGFDIDDLFHSSSNENLPAGDDMKDDTPDSVEATQRLGEDDVIALKVAEPSAEPSNSSATGQRMELPHYTETNLQNVDRALESFKQLDDHTPEMSQEDDLSELFYGMSNEDVTCGAMQTCSPPNNNNFYDQLVNTDVQSEEFKLQEIPKKLRVEYDDIPNNVGRFGWKPPGINRQINQVAKEFIATHSFVSQTLTTQFRNSQPYTQFHSESNHDSQPLSVQGQSSLAYATQSQNNTCSYNQSVLVVASDPSSGAYYSEDPRSLKYARKVQSSSALPQPYSQDCASRRSNYIPDAIHDRIPQHLVPGQSSISHPVHFQSQMSLHCPVQYQTSQDYTAQFGSFQLEIVNDGFSPVSPPPSSQMSISRCINQRREAALCAIPPMFRHSGLVSREVSQPQNSSQIEVCQPLRVPNEPTTEKLVEVLQYSEGHTQLPRAPVFKRRRTTSADVDEGDSGVGRSVCTSLSSLMTIHGGYSKSLRRNEL